MSAVLQEKRGYSTAEAMAYLGVKRRAFEEHIAPHCFGVKIGTTKVWEKAELDAAWEKYKIDAGSERPAEKGERQWDAKQPVSSQKKPAMKLISGTRGNAFENAASAVLKKRKDG